MSAARSLSIRAVGGIVVSTLLIVVVGLLGPSVLVLTLGDKHRPGPPFWFGSDPSGWFVTLMIWAAILIGAYSLWCGWRALQAGWQPRVRRLVALGVACTTAVILVPPMASGDVLIYAAYGRIAATGGNPYTTTPADVLRLGYDPVVVGTEKPWQGAKSIYGPVCTGISWLASKLGGDSVQLTVWWLQVAAALFFVACGLLLLVLVGPDADKRRRAALMGLANPLMIWAVVVGAHNEAIGVTFGLLALFALRRHVFVAGLLLGVAGASKLSVGLVGVAMLWVLRDKPIRCVQLVVGTLITMGGLYAAAGGIQAFRQAQSQSSFISTGTPSRVLWHVLDFVMPQALARTIVIVLSWLLLVAVAILLSQVFPRTLVPSRGDGDVTPAAVRLVAIYSLAWLLTAVWTLPWYDLTGWLALAAVAAVPRLDRTLAIRTAILSMAFVPGRDPKAIDMSASLEFVADRVKDSLTPAVELALLVGLIVWARRRGAQWWPYGWPPKLPAAWRRPALTGRGLDGVTIRSTDGGRQQPPPPGPTAADDPAPSRPPARRRTRAGR